MFFQSPPLRYPGVFGPRVMLLLLFIYIFRPVGVHLPRHLHCVRALFQAPPPAALCAFTGLGACTLLRVYGWCVRKNDRLPVCLLLLMFWPTISRIYIVQLWVRHIGRTRVVEDGSGYFPRTNNSQGIVFRRTVTFFVEI